MHPRWTFCLFQRNSRWCHPVKECLARDVSEPRDSQVALMEMYWRFFPIPKEIQISADGFRETKSWNSPIIMTTTSVSTVRLSTLSDPLVRAFRTCTAILVSASSWSHLCISVEPLLETTDSSEVMLTSLSSEKLKLATLFVRREKNYFLLLLS